MRKRVSKRRWKARCRLGRSVPKSAIVEFGLTKWFHFVLEDDYGNFYRATMTN